MVEGRSLTDQRRERGAELAVGCTAFRDRLRGRILRQVMSRTEIGPENRGRGRAARQHDGEGTASHQPARAARRRRAAAMVRAQHHHLVLNTRLTSLDHLASCFFGSNRTDCAGPPSLKYGGFPSLSTTMQERSALPPLIFSSS